MMRTMEMRSLQYRDSDDGTLILDGIAVPYNESVDYMGIRESFAEAAFDEGQATGQPLLWSHQRDEQVGHITSATNTPKGLRVEAVVQPTVRGRDAITLLRSKSLRGLSVGFEPSDWITDSDGSVTYVRAILHELSLTPLPVYPTAEVTATRDKPTEGNTAMDTAALDGLTTRLDSIEARMTRTDTPKPRTLSVRDAFVAQLADTSKSNGRLRALADVISTGNTGVLPQDWYGEVRNTLDGMRYLIPKLGTVPFPTTGHSLALPKVVNHTTVGPRGVEKTPIPSNALTTGQDFYTATWYAGGVDIALELVAQSDPSILAIVVEDMLRAYASVTDTAVTAALEAAATPAGSTLDTTTYAKFVEDIVGVGDLIRIATGSFGDMLAVTTASWKKIIGFVDTTGRRILSTGGGTNSDGSASLTSGEVNVAGITVFHNPPSAEDMQFNTISARVAERPPLQVQADNVALMGRDVGILGAVMDLPVYPAGIIVHSATTMEAASESRRK